MNRAACIVWAVITQYSQPFTSFTAEFLVSIWFSCRLKSPAAMKELSKSLSEINLQTTFYFYFVIFIIFSSGYGWRFQSIVDVHEVV